MLQLQHQFEELQQFTQNAPIKIETLGNFTVWRNQQKIDAKEFGRDKAIQLLQYLVCYRKRNALHKEKIMDHLWDDWNDNDFKVALHGIQKALDPHKTNRKASNFIIRQGVSYQLDLQNIWIDVEVFEKYIEIGNKSLLEDKNLCKKAYSEAIQLYQGSFLPNRIYDDWTTEEREKSQLLILSTYIALAELLVDENPLESIRLAQNAIQIDATWEDAYKVQMQAYLNKGNRPQAIKTYMKCEAVLEDEYGISPLPETKKLLAKIESI